MKKITLYFLSLLLLSSMYSCLDDKNDYNYSQINGLKGNASQMMPSVYSVGVNEDLEIKPKFEFTVDKAEMDLSYEWLLDGKLLDVKTPEYTFNSSKGGLFELTFSVIDNKTGVKYSASANISVRSPYQRGWVILSEVNGESALSFIKMKTLYGVTETVDVFGDPVVRDSVVFRGVEKYVVKNLGTNPKGIMENLGYPATFGQLETVYDELVVMQDRWVELNGNTLEREVYTDEEFGGDLPEGGFKPVDASMSFSAKFVRDENGYIYMHMKPYANDFHAGVYMSIPLWNKTVFSALYPSQKFRSTYQDAVLACRKKDNSLVIIRDGGVVDYNETNPALTLNSISKTGNVLELMGDNASKFQNMGNKSIVSLLPATVNKGDWKQAWVALMKESDSNLYELRFFRIDGDNTEVQDYYENNAGDFGDQSYTDMTVFNNKKFAIIATGNKLWYWQYADATWNNFTLLPSTSPILLKEFSNDIVSISSNDINIYPGYGVYNGQLGVALDDGSFWIYEVIEGKKDASGKIVEPIVKQLFPNEETDKEGDNNFGKIVDTLYKIGNAKQITRYDL